MADPNAEFTGSIPAAYDRFLGPMLFEPYAADLVSRLDPSRLTAVLEIAAGTGILTGHLRRVLPPAAALTATDLNEAMLDHAKERLPGLAIAWRRADAQELPFPDASFDAVACQFGMMFVPDKARAFAEARRVLRPGGGLVFSVWGALADNPLGRIAHDVIGRFFTSDPPDFYEVPFGFHDERLIRRLLGDAGFEVAGCHPVSLPARSPSHLDAARGLVTGNPILLAVNERATAPVEEIVQAVAAALAAEGGVAPFELETRALVVVARAAPTPSKGESDYVITPARPRDVPHLAAIERDAAQLLRGHAPDSLLDQTLDPAELFAAQAAGLLWVALRGDVPVGFALVRILAADLPHLEEIDVDPRHGRRGAGTALVRAVCEWTRRSGYPGITLTTFRAVPWNMPFYARLGFEELRAGDLRRELVELVAGETSRGLDPRRRVVMRYRAVAS